MYKSNDGIMSLPQTAICPGRSAFPILNRSYACGCKGIEGQSRRSLTRRDKAIVQYKLANKCISLEKECMLKNNKFFISAFFTFKNVCPKTFQTHLVHCAGNFQRVLAIYNCA